MKLKKSTGASAGELVHSVLSGLNHDTGDFAVFKLWDDLAATYAPRSEALGLVGKKLVVGVPSHAHQQQLTLAKREILRRINQALGKPLLKEITFQVGQPRAETSPNG